MNPVLFGAQLFSLVSPTSAPEGTASAGLSVDIAGKLSAAAKAAEEADAKSREMEQIAAELTAASDAAMAKLKADSETLRLSLLTPLEEAVAELERLNELKAFGRLTEETQARAATDIWERAKAQILKDNRLEIKPFVDPSAGLVERGTAAAFSAERQANNTLKEMLELQKAADARGAEELRLLEDLKTAFNKAGVDVRVNSL